MSDIAWPKSITAESPHVIAHWLVVGNRSLAWIIAEGICMTLTKSQRMRRDCAIWMRKLVGYELGGILGGGPHLDIHSWSTQLIRFSFVNWMESIVMLFHLRLISILKWRSVLWILYFGCSSKSTVRLLRSEGISESKSFKTFVQAGERYPYTQDYVFLSLVLF